MRHLGGTGSKLTVCSYRQSKIRLPINPQTFFTSVFLLCFANSYCQIFI